MKTMIAILSLISTLSASAQTLSACESATSVNLTDEQAKRLCHGAIDRGPVLCFDLTSYKPLQSHSKMGLNTDEAISLCRGATLETFKVPVACYNATLVSLTDEASVIACSGAHNDAPANCANTLVQSKQQGALELNDNQIGYACRHSINAGDTIEFLNARIKQGLSVQQAVKSTHEFNEARY